MKVLFGAQLIAGMILVLLSPALGDVVASFGAAEKAGGAIILSYFMGGTLSTLGLSWLPRFLSSRKILQLCSLSAGLCLFGFSLAESLAEALVIYFFLGASNAILVAFPGALLANRYREESGRMMSVMYAFFAAGVTLCPLVCGFFLQEGLPWRWLYQGMAAVCLAYAFLAFAFSLPSMGESEGLSLRSLKEARQGDRGLLVGTVILNILYIGGETSIIGWVVYYLQKVFAAETSVFRASRVLTYFWLFMILGRVFTAFVVGRVGALRTLVFLAFGGILAWTAAMLVRDLVAAEVMFSLTGFFFSGMFPVIASYAGRFPARHTGLVFSVIVAGGGVGGGLFPFFVGWLAERNGLQTGLASALFSLPLMLVVLWALKRRGAVV